MLQETGIVVADDGQYIWVETVRASACNSCSAKAGCGQAVIGDLFDEKAQMNKNLMRLPSPGVDLVGQEVTLGIPEDALLKTSILVYGVPLVTLLTGATLAQGLWQNDLLSGLGAILGFAVGMLLSRVKSRAWECESRYHPQLVNLPIKSVNIE